MNKVLRARRFAVTNLFTKNVFSSSYISSLISISRRITCVIRVWTLYNRAEILVFATIFTSAKWFLRLDLAKKRFYKYRKSTRDFQVAASAFVSYRYYMLMKKKKLRYF